MVSGNGIQGFVSSGAPYSDTFIFQNMHFIMPNENIRYCPETFNELETVKQSIIKGKDITDNASYDDVYRFHPGGQLRIETEKNKETDYIRYQDYETSQTGVKFTDKNGEWNRVSFTSMSDGAVITKLGSSDKGVKINAVLSFDDISTLANFGSSDEVNLKYKRTVTENADAIAFIAHYPDYKNSELKNGGYATLTYVITKGGTKEKITVENKNTQTEEQFKGTNSGIKISDAESVYLITLSDRTYDMGGYSDFDRQESFALADSLYGKTKAVAEKYQKNGDFDYQKALENHLAVYQPIFDAVTLELDEDNFDSNEELLKAQKGKKKINSALAQRTYYAGRYAYICCSGYSTSRLYGMWTGEWNTGWGSKYTMDANVNLQTSSLNTGNISSAPIGYTYFILRQLPDWQENAYATHGFTNAIQAPVNTDGDKAVITETCYPYPFRYWNSGTSWMLLPLYETLQCYGNLQIPLSDEFNLEELKNVLSVTDKPLTEQDIKAIENKGYLSLQEDILLPLLIKSANYWRQLLTPEYYTDENGNIKYEKGKQALAENESYCILPSYSPENNPTNYPSPSTANCAIDISACRSNIEMLLDIAEATAYNADLSKYKDILNNLPPYLYDETGALKEWAAVDFEENNKHRHLSHLYCVWPMFESRKDPELEKACKQAVANRTSENEASHALIHRALIAAGLKDRDSLSAALTKLMNHKIRYDSLMTNHDYDRNSCFCTDFAIGYLGIVNESLVYSENGAIEILPSVPLSGFDKGTVTGLRTKTRAEITSLKWNLSENTASVTVTSDTEQTVKISCGLSTESKELHLTPKQAVSVEFTLDILH